MGSPTQDAAGYPDDAEPMTTATDSPAARAGTRPAPLLTPAFLMLAVADLAYFTAAGVAIFALPLYVTGPLGSDEAGAGLAFGAFAAQKGLSFAEATLMMSCRGPALPPRDRLPERPPQPFLRGHAEATGVQGISEQALTGRAGQGREPQEESASVRMLRPCGRGWPRTTPGCRPARPTTPTGPAGGRTAPPATGRRKPRIRAAASGHSTIEAPPGGGPTWAATERRTAARSGGSVATRNPIREEVELSLPEPVPERGLVHGSLTFMRSDAYSRRPLSGIQSTAGSVPPR